MSKKRAWNQQEITKLITLYEAGNSIHNIAGQLRRPEEAVRAQAYELRTKGLLIQSQSLYQDDWSKVEDEFLLQNLGHLTPSQLAGALGRTPASIKKRTNQLDAIRGRSKASFKRRRNTNIAKLYGNVSPIELKGPTRIGYREHLGVTVRSSWEANFLTYLNHKKVLWEYEPKLFVFDTVVRGKKAYKPDVWLPGEDKWIEVKGRLLSDNKTKTRRFRQFYPEEYGKLEVVVKRGSEADKFYTKMGIPVYIYYDDLEKKYSHLPNWEGKPR